MESMYTCDDFLAFQETLKAMRKIDDNVVYALNTTIPTVSFTKDSSQLGQQCQQFYNQLKDSYSNRENAIKTCINVASNRIKTLKETNNSNTELEALKELRKEQMKLRLMQNELNVEEVVKDRSLKIFHERCRQFYKPPDIKY